MRRVVSLLILALFLFLSAVEAKKPKKKCGAISWANCPKKGSGGDPRLNERKNIKTKPAAADVEEKTLDEIADL